LLCHGHPINLGLPQIEQTHPPRSLLSLSLFLFSKQPSAVIESKEYALHQLSFLKHLKASVLTDTRRVTERVNTGMGGVAEKNAAQITA
jgi:hypothetical protein